MNERSWFPVWAERALLLVAAPLLFAVVAEAMVRLAGVETDVARNRNAQIAVPVWLLADASWASTSRDQIAREGRPIAAEELAWLHHFEEARYLTYKLKPDLDVKAINPFNSIDVAKGVEFAIRPNSDGFRGDDFQPKPHDRLRIVTLGDSSTFGWGVDEADTYQQLLLERLRRWQGERIEIVNLGMPGHNSRHGREVMQRYALRLEPDLLIISYGANDGRLVLQPAEELVAAHYGWQADLRFALLRLRSYRLLRRLLIGAIDPLRADVTNVLERAAAVPTIDYQRNLKRMIEAGVTVDANTILLSVCTQPPYEAAIRFVASEVGVPLVSARKAFVNTRSRVESGELYPEQLSRYREIYGTATFEAQPPLYFTSDGCHPHAVGHNIIADELERVVKQALRPKLAVLASSRRTQ